MAFHQQLLPQHQQQPIDVQQLLQLCSALGAARPGPTSDADQSHAQTRSSGHPNKLQDMFTPKTIEWALEKFRIGELRLMGINQKAHETLRHLQAALEDLLGPSCQCDPQICIQPISRHMVGFSLRFRPTHSQTHDWFQLAFRPEEFQASGQPNHITNLVEDLMGDQVRTWHQSGSIGCSQEQIASALDWLTEVAVLRYAQDNAAACQYKVRFSVIDNLRSWAQTSVPSGYVSAGVYNPFSSVSQSFLRAVFNQQIRNAEDCPSFSAVLQLPPQLKLVLISVARKGACGNEWRVLFSRKEAHILSFEPSWSAQHTWRTTPGVIERTDSESGEQGE